jgi:hypothetical protein
MTQQASYDVIILGAGASGLMCALTAGQRGRRVLVIEKANKIGKKILMSGGGRCNFTNYDVEPNHYLSQNPHFCKAALKRYTQWDFISLVNDHQIAYEERDHGQLFCRDSAKDILAMLLKECERAGVEIITHTEVKSVKPMKVSEHFEGRSQSRYHVSGVQHSEKKSFLCESLVIATGALSIPSLGGSGMGYDLATQFSLPLVPRRAGLVPFMFSDHLKPICERLSGLALEVAIRCRSAHFVENLLFTHRGMSGPVVLQISNYWQPGDEIIIDLVPGLNLADWLIDSKKSHPKTLLKNRLGTKLSKGLVNELQTLFWSSHANTVLADCSDKFLRQVGQQLNNWTVKPSATEGYRTAEVTLGGVDTDAISSKTMEAKNQPGLYFTGEVLDVTGHLGGYNFQWAWSSGFSAGSFV